MHGYTEGDKNSGSLVSMVISREGRRWGIKWDLYFCPMYFCIFSVINNANVFMDSDVIFSTKTKWVEKGLL